MPAATPAPTSQARVPFRPVEEALTPPPDIDTSGWLVYLDAEHGFELKYPPDARVKQNVRPPTLGTEGTGTEIDLPFPVGTTLTKKYLFVTTADLSSAVSCLPRIFTNVLKPGQTPTVQSIRSENAKFWKSREPGGMMQQWFDTAAYQTTRGGTCITLDGVLSGFSNGPLETKSPAPNIENETQVFTAIISTFRWTR